MSLTEFTISEADLAQAVSDTINPYLADPAKGLQLVTRLIAHPPQDRSQTQQKHLAQLHQLIHQTFVNLSARDDYPAEALAFRELLALEDSLEELSFFPDLANKKFLKKHDTELRHITQLFHAFCLDYPLIHFKFFSDKKQMLNCPPTQKIIDRCAQLWQNIPAQHMLALDTQSDSDTISISGAISDHQNFRFDRTGIFLFVNNRWIKDFKLSNALIKGYMNVAPPGRYPMASLAITIDSKLVDINVHPRKEEVRFLNPRTIEQLIQKSVKACLEENIAKHIPSIKNAFNFAPTPMTSHYDSEIPKRPEYHQKPYTSFNFDASFPEPHAWDSINTLPNQPPIRQAAPFYEQRNAIEEYKAYPSILRQAQDERNSGQTAPHNYYDNLEATVQTTTVGPEAFARPEAVEATIQLTTKSEDLLQATITHHTSTNGEQSYTLIGQYHKTYILIEQKEGLFIVDQHAAHERILYELFAHRFADVATVHLLFPLIISLSQDDMDIIEPYLPLFIENGINVEIFGLNQLKIQATPVHLKDASLEDLIKQTIGWINEYKYLDKEQFIKKLHEKLRAQMACKAAVKAGDVLTHAHMEQLLTTLHATENRLTCPHGRPTSWLLSNHDIEKKFKRKL